MILMFVQTYTGIPPQESIRYLLNPLDFKSVYSRFPASVESDDAKYGYLQAQHTPHYMVGA